MPSEPRRRAKRGTIAESLVLRMDATLAEYLRRSADSEGVSVTEFIRRAIHERVLRLAAGTAGIRT